MCELRQAREDNRQLLRRIMKERDGAQLQLESTVAYWMERVEAAERQRGPPPSLGLRDGQAEGASERKGQ